MTVIQILPVFGDFIHMVFQSLQSIYCSNFWFKKGAQHTQVNTVVCPRLFLEGYLPYLLNSDSE